MKLVITLLFCLFFSSTFGQKTKNKQKPATSSVVTNFRKTHGYEIKLLRAIGNKAEQTVTVEIEVLNTNATVQSTGRKGRIYDENNRPIGKARDSYDYGFFGDDAWLAFELVTDMPIVASFEFKQILPSVTFIKFFKFELNYAMFKDEPIVFKNIPVIWK